MMPCNGSRRPSGYTGPIDTRAGVSSGVEPGMFVVVLSHEEITGLADRLEAHGEALYDEADELAREDGYHMTIIRKRAEGDVDRKRARELRSVVESAALPGTLSSSEGT